MDALITQAPGYMVLEDIPPPPEPGPGQILVEVDAAGICGSDYGLYLGKHPLSTFPMIQGHEFCGTIRKIGSGGSDRLSVGRRVAVEPLLGCNECYPCSIGRYNCCTRLQLLGVHKPGGFQRSLVVDERLAHDVGDLPADIAAFAEPLTIALQAVARGNVGQDERVYVVGAGPIGLALLLACRWRGARVAISDLVPHRLEKARAIGAEVTFDARGDVSSGLATWTEGRGPPIVIDATGSPAVIRGAIDQVASAGRIVTVGISNSEVPLPIALMIRKELTILASRNSVRMFPEAIKALHVYRAEVASIITHHIGLSDVEATIKLALQRPDIVEKAVVVAAKGSDQ